MRDGMVRLIGLPQKDAAGRELFVRRLARRDEQRDMRPYRRHVARQRVASHLAWHMVVSEEKVDRGRSRFQVSESFFRMPSFQHLEARITHRDGDQKPD